MALSAFMTVEGAKQGKIKGSVVQKDHEGAIAVQTADHEIVSPRDPQNGMPTGKRMHKAFIIRKEVDKSSPPLYSALTNNELLKNVEVRFSRTAAGPGAQGVDQVFYSIQLTNAQVVSIRLLTPDALAGAKSNPAEEVQFVYRSIKWTILEGGLTAEDTVTP